jgi:PAS domain S-box-containing protein
MKTNGSILVVDDDAAILHLYSRCLIEAGYNVMEAATGRKCLQLVREKRPDLVLLDVQLPDVSGIEVCRQIKSDADLQDVSVVLCSGGAISSNDKVDGLEIGADDYLTKPVSYNEMVARLRMLMRLRNSVAELRASEEHHRRVLDILPDAVCLVQPNGRITSVNSKAVSMLGCRESAELIGKNFCGLTSAKDQELIRKDFKDALISGVIRDAEYSLLKTNGTMLRVELRATVTHGSDGQPAGLVCVVRDITERKEAAEKIQQLLTLLDQAHDAIMVCDLEGRIRYFNQGAERILGWLAQEVQGRGVSELFFQHRPTFAEAQDTLLRTGEWHGELLLFTKTKKPVIFQSQWTLARFSKESSPMVVSIYTDVTERNLAEEKLKEQAALSRHILRTAMEGYCRLDMHGKFLDVNEACCQMTGYSREELLSLSISDLDANKSVPELALQHMQHILKSGGDRFETRYRRKNGRLIEVEVIATSLRLSGNYIFKFFRDVTERKRAEEELRSLHRRVIEVQEAERLRLAFEIHDGINQLIASVKMRLKNVELSLPRLKPAAREILSRCDQLLARALEENRRIARNLRPSDLDDFGLFAACRNFCDEMQLRTNLEIQCRIPASTKRLPPAIELNLFRIVQEAINNIEKHARAQTIKVQLGFRGNSIHLRIQDDGRGFDLHAPSPSRNRSHGIGLTNMRERASSLGGTCKIQSLAQKGTTITVTVPLLAATAKAARPAGAVA